MTVYYLSLTSINVYVYLSIFYIYSLYILMFVYEDIFEYEL